MPAQYPTDVFVPRAVENRPGVTYDPDDTKTFFAEDLNAVTEEIVAIENELGASPKGDDDTVAERLDRMEQEAVETGWRFLAAEGARVDNDSMTLTGDFTGLLQKGDKIKLTNSTTKYFFIVSVPSFSSGLNGFDI